MPFFCVIGIKELKYFWLRSVVSLESFFGLLILFVLTLILDQCW